jgi:hypothetical protein
MLGVGQAGCNRRGRSHFTTQPQTDCHFVNPMSCELRLAWGITMTFERRGNFTTEPVKQIRRVSVCNSKHNHD